ncbi:uncharacterized protein HMPREF1541_09857 [Cyphellophora europaea CBS 101466]|uniref:Clr5 domain-containing protein n=1 Tax=Cyphellophora europaea (strain CBS 101466) TaxID=1220924 RepID=W2S8E8_CYPE1|nr:uncharacterized protein HMPREF1541_09857 [Cyphellophora europaea CBS 101466]ETN44981.1 hypothetical protein HMPREF1541_09857 [Cyphellophora europaea CBS 101466]
MSLAPRISAAVWEEHKEAIFQCYIQKGRTLAQLRREMLAKYQFDATVSQYTTKLDKWDFKKNHSRQKWSDIDASLQRRSLSSSTATVLSRKKVIPKNRLERATTRYRPLEWDRRVPVARAETPDDIIIHAAPPHRPRMKIVCDFLPWQDFLSRSGWKAICSQSQSMVKTPTQGSYDLADPSISLPLLARSPHRLNGGMVNHLLPLNGTNVMRQVSQLSGPTILSLMGRSPNSLRSLSDLVPALTEWTRQFVVEPSRECSPISALAHITDEDSEVAVRGYAAYMAFVVSNNLFHRPNRVEQATWRAMQSLALLWDKHLGARVLSEISGANTPTAHALLTELGHAAIESGANDLIIALIERRVLSTNSPTNGPVSRTLLQTAIRSDNIDIVRFLIAKGVDVSASNLSERTRDKCHDPCLAHQNLPLSLAVKLKQPDRMVQLLLESGSTATGYGELYWAIKRHASLNTISGLLNAGADPNYLVRSFRWVRNREVLTLSMAAERGDNSLVQLLLKHNASPNMILSTEAAPAVDINPRLDVRFRSPLMAAVDSENYEVAELLLEHGADPNISSFDSWLDYKRNQGLESCLSTDAPGMNECFYVYPMQVAIARGQQAMIQRLNDCGASLNVGWVTPLVAIADFHSRSEIVAWLVEQGADINATTDSIYGFAALEAAIYTRNISLLCPAGANVNLVPRREGGRSALQAAAEIGKFSIFDSPVEIGADIHVPCAPAEGLSLLEAVVMHDDHERVRQLLSMELSPSQERGSKGSPLGRAVALGDLEMIRLLIAAGPDINEKASVDIKIPYDRDYVFHFRDDNFRDEITPLHQAAIAGNVNVLENLLSMGAEINTLSATYRLSALHLAIVIKKYAIAEALVRKGAEINTTAISQRFSARRSNFTSPLISAISLGCTKLVKLLIEYGADVNMKVGLFDRSLYNVYALEVACERLDLILVELLLKSGARANDGYPIIAAIRAYKYCWIPESPSTLPRIIKVLILHGADMARNHEIEGLPLRMAVECCNLDVMKQLVDAGADVNAVSATEGEYYYARALAAAVDSYSLEKVAYLLTQGAEVNAGASSGNCALEVAADRGLLCIANLLLKHGAFVTIRAVSNAASSGRLDMVKFLLDNYNGPEPISKVCEIVSVEARKLNQWFVLELLRDYKPPTAMERVVPIVTPVAYVEQVDEPTAGDNMFSGATKDSLDRPMATETPHTVSVGTEGKAMAGSTALGTEAAIPCGMRADVYMTEAPDEFMTGVLEEEYGLYRVAWRS